MKTYTAPVDGAKTELIPPLVLSQRDWLGEAPRIRVVQMIEARFYRGEGESDANPVREVTVLYRMDGTEVVQIDPFMEDS